MKKRKYSKVSLEKMSNNQVKTSQLQQVKGGYDTGYTFYGRYTA